MTGDNKPGTAALDRADTRVRHDEGLGGALRGFLDRVRSGDLGSLPVVVGLAVIWTVFQTLNPVFLSANNLVNLLFDCSTVGVIALGIVCILMVGEIDLSVGSVSGFASALVGVLWVNADWPVAAAIPVALLAGAVIGSLYAVLFNRLGMPSFVSTLAGLLAILGLQLYILGSSGSINLPYGSPVVNLGQTLVMPPVVSYALVLLAGAAVLYTGIPHGRAPPRRRPDAALDRRCRGPRRRAHRGPGTRRRLPQHGPRRPVDVRPLRRARRPARLRPEAHQVGPLDDGGRAATARRPGAPASTCAGPI